MKHDFFNLKNKVAIVTGGNQGIGKVVAGYLADAGADVVIFDLNDASEVAEKIAEEYGVRTAAFVCKMCIRDRSLRIQVHDSNVSSQSSGYSQA